MVCCIAGQTLRARHVIITVPILALQNQSIAFNPALPRDKHAAISRIQMSNAVKVCFPMVMLSVECTRLLLLACPVRTDQNTFCFPSDRGTISAGDFGLQQTLLAGWFL